MPPPPVRRPDFLAAFVNDAGARPAAFAAAPAPAPRPLRPPRAAPVAADGAAAEPAYDAAALAALRSEAMTKVAHAVEVLRLQAERLAEQARSDALELAFDVARRILEAELQTGPEALFALVRGALKRTGESRRIVVRLHPEDAAFVGARAGERLGLATSEVAVVADATLDRGDCVVDTDFGKIDGRLRTRLDELHRAARAAAEEGVA